MVDKENSNKQIDGEALLDNFRTKNIENFPYYIKSIWKDLSRRSDNPEKGFCKVIFSNYYDIPGIISTRLFNLLDKDQDGYLSYNEFSKGMTSLFLCNLDVLLKFIFDLFDENNDGVINSNDVRTLFQYIPLQNKKFSENSFQDRIESQEELQDIIEKSFKNKSEMTFKEFKTHTEKENSTIFLYITVFLLTKKPFNEKTLSFYQSEDKEKEKGSSISKTNLEDKRPMLIASPNLTSKFSPSLKILHSPIMKEQKEKLKKEILAKYSQNQYDPNRPDDKLYSTKSTDFTHLNNTSKENMMNKIGSGDKYEKNVDLLHPSRQNKQVNSDEKENQMPDPNIMSPYDLQMLNSITSLPQEDITYDGYLIKLVDDKLKKLWFTLFDKYLYCKNHMFILFTSFSLYFFFLKTINTKQTQFIKECIA